MHIFGLTGGIGSGKSTVGRQFAARGIPIVDADQIARDVVEPGTEGLALIAARFRDVLTSDGALDRKALARIAFATPEGRRDLGAITHPRIAMRSAELFQEYEKQGTALICYEAALLVENGIADGFRPLVLVDAPEAMQIARTLARDGGTPAEVEARIRAQLPRETKRAAADFIIDNSGTPAELVERADDALRFVLTRLKLNHAPYFAQ